MKILIDECLPRRLKTLLKPAATFTVQDMGWGGEVNGSLISLAINSGFTVFITVDKNLQHQNRLAKYEMAMIVLDISRNKFEFIEPLKPKIIAALAGASQHRLQIVS